jgi:hypothetical protein
MISVKVNIDHHEKIAANLEAQVSKIVMAVALGVEGEAKRSIMQRKSKYRRYYVTRGRVVARKKNGKVVGGRVRRIRREHWSSAPGDAPNADTGFLANSIFSRRLTKYKSQAYCTARYGLPLELGWATKSGKRVRARPFMRPALEKYRPRFVRMIKGALRDYK